MLLIPFCNQPFSPLRRRLSTCDTRSYPIPRPRILRWINGAPEAYFHNERTGQRQVAQTKTAALIDHNGCQLTVWNPGRATPVAGTTSTIIFRNDLDLDVVSTQYHDERRQHPHLITSIMRQYAVACVPLWQWRLQRNMPWGEGTRQCTNAAPPRARHTAEPAENTSIQAMTAMLQAYLNKQQIDWLVWIRALLLWHISSSESRSCTPNLFPSLSNLAIGQTRKKRKTRERKGSPIFGAAI